MTSNNSSSLNSLNSLGSTNSIGSGSHPRASPQPIPANPYSGFAASSPSSGLSSSASSSASTSSSSSSSLSPVYAAAAASPLRAASATLTTATLVGASSPAAMTAAAARASPRSATASRPASRAASLRGSDRGTHARTASSSSKASASAVAAAPQAPEPKVLPRLFEDAELEDVLVLVADMLTKLTQHNDGLPLHPASLTRFHSRATPNISLRAYLRRMARYTSVEKSSVLILLVYIDRVCERMAGFTICGLTVHRFVCAAVLCASKALCDAFNTNSHYARVGGITLAEMNLLEKEFLRCIDWHLTCSGEVLQCYYEALVRSHEGFQVEKEQEAQREAQAEPGDGAAVAAPRVPRLPARASAGTANDVEVDHERCEPRMQASVQPDASRSEPTHVVAPASAGIARETTTPRETQRSPSKRRLPATLGDGAKRLLKSPRIVAPAEAEG
ncbi:Pho80p cyclin [Thecaphora frezii]